MTKEYGSANGHERYPSLDTRTMDMLLLEGPTDVLFDAESTVVITEFFVEGQRARGAGTEAEDITNSAMGGGMPFHHSVPARAEIVKPTHRMMDSINALNARSFSPGAITLLSGLHQLGIRTTIVSGGFGELFTLAGAQIPHTPIYANTMCFDSRGNYAGWHDGAILAQNGGKELWLRGQQAQGSVGKNVIMVGDGMTDMSIRSACLRIAYGGVVHREAVARTADASVRSMAALFPLLTGERHWKLILERYSAWRRMFVQGAQELLAGHGTSYGNLAYGTEHLRRLQWYLHQT